MYFSDYNLIFDTSSALDADSTSSAVDVGVNVGACDNVSVLAEVIADSTSAGTLTVKVEQSADGSTSWTSVDDSAATTFSALDVGDTIEVPMPASNQRYLRVVLDVSADLGTGAVKTLITPAITRS